MKLIMENLTMVDLLLKAANACDSESGNGRGYLLRQAADRIETQQERIYQLENERAKLEYSA